ncbi:hypothetical protein ACFSSC_07205 [Corynebacterium mendelii]|uniref:Uncharacterized protein n=2 Tax=Corynebacterium mendelii TaxID=2765362 RepID=A0A939E339_9CORY|nr:hypothetical protein [Corynebacterium mendelii]
MQTLAPVDGAGGEELIIQQIMAHNCSGENLLQLLIHWACHGVGVPVPGVTARAEKIVAAPRLADIADLRTAICSKILPGHKPIRTLMHSTWNRQRNNYSLEPQRGESVYGILIDQIFWLGKGEAGNKRLIDTPLAHQPFAWRKEQVTLHIRYETTTLPLWRINGQDTGGSRVTPARKLLDFSHADQYGTLVKKTCRPDG